MLGNTDSVFASLRYLDLFWHYSVFYFLELNMVAKQLWANPSGKAFWLCDFCGTAHVDGGLWVQWTENKLPESGFKPRVRTYWKQCVSQHIVGVLVRTVSLYVTGNVSDPWDKEKLMMSNMHIHLPCFFLHALNPDFSDEMCCNTQDTLHWHRI